MNKLTPPMKTLIENYTAGAVATINAHGLPAVSPKATFVVVDDSRIAFGNIRSPGTVANIHACPEVEVNFIRCAYPSCGTCQGDSGSRG